MGLLTSISKVCSKLDKLGIEYMISGSFAMGAYDTPRSSNYVDLVVNIKNENVEILLNEFPIEEYYVNPQTVKTEVNERGFFNIIDKQSGNKIDFIVLKNHPHKQLEFQRKKIRNLFGTNFWIVSLEDLILAKLQWMQDSASEKQRDDIENLFRDTEPDLTYIHQWCKDLNLNTFNLL